MRTSSDGERETETGKDASDVRLPRDEQRHGGRGCRGAVLAPVAVLDLVQTEPRMHSTSSEGR